MLGFNTPIGPRGAVVYHVFEKFGDDPLPYYLEPQYSPVSTPELAGGIPLRAHHRRPRLRVLPQREPPDPVLPRTQSRPAGGGASQNGGSAWALRTGSGARCTTSSGRAKLKAKVSHDRGREHHPRAAWLVVPRRRGQRTQSVRHVPLEHQQPGPQLPFRQVGLRRAVQVPFVQHQAPARKPRYRHAADLGEVQRGPERAAQDAATACTRAFERREATHGLLDRLRVLHGLPELRSGLQGRARLPGGHVGHPRADRRSRGTSGDGTFNYNCLPFPTDLCDLCAARTAVGREPTCVHHCLANVMYYGPVEELARNAAERRPSRCCSCRSTSRWRRAGRSSRTTSSRKDATCSVR